MESSTDFERHTNGNWADAEFHGGAPHPPEPAVASAESDSQPLASAAPDTVDIAEFVPAVARLVVGLAVEGALELTHLLQQWEAENPSGQRVARLLEEMTPAERARFAALGLAVESAQRVQGAAESVADRAMSLGQGWAQALRPLTSSRLLAPMRRRAAALGRQTDAAIQRWIETGQFEEAHGRALARNTVASIVDRVVGHLEHNETTQALIESQAGAYLDKLTADAKVQRLIEAQAGAYLQTLANDPAQLDALVEQVAGRYIDQIMENPEQVQALIRQEAGQYLDYLQENPEQVQDLVQGQSVSMAGEVLDEVRVRAVTADTLLERIAHGVFRRPVRSTQAPPEVRQLADYVTSEVQAPGVQNHSAESEAH